MTFRELNSEFTSFSPDIYLQMEKISTVKSDSPIKRNGKGFIELPHDSDIEVWDKIVSMIKKGLFAPDIF